MNRIISAGVVARTLAKAIQEKRREYLRENIVRFKGDRHAVRAFMRSFDSMVIGMINRWRVG